MNGTILIPTRTAVNPELAAAAPIRMILRVLTCGLALIPSFLLKPVPGFAARSAIVSQIPSEDPGNWKLVTTRTFSANTKAGWSSPAWSPDGAFLAAMAGDQVFITEYPPVNPLHMVAAGVADFTWSPDARQLACITRVDSLSSGFDAIAVYNVVTQETKIVLSEKGNRFSNLAWTKTGDILVADQLGGIRGNWTLREARPDPSEAFVPSTGQLFLAVIRGGGDTIDLWKLLIGGAAEKVGALSPCRAALPDPTQSRVAAATLSNGRALRVVIADLNGNVESELGTDVHPTAWSANGRYLMGWKASSTDGNETLGSADLWVFDINRQTLMPITDTPMALESEPAWHPHAPVVAYVDAASGELYVARLKEK